MNNSKLLFLKTSITNALRLTNINQSVGYVPILKHDKNAKADCLLSY